MNVTRTITLVATVVALTPAALRGQDDRFEWRGRVARGDVIEVKGVTGDIRAVRGTGSEVTVVATKHGYRRNFADIEFEVVEGRGGVTICAMYPPSRRSRRRGPLECEPGGWRNLDVDDSDVDVDFEVRVPPGVHFAGRTISGDVDVASLQSHVLARTVSGDIRISTSDLADASTVSGSIDVAMGRADWSGDLEFHTVSGDIVLEFASTLHADVEFESVSGDMESDFPITLRSRSNGWVGGHVRGTIGDGGRSLSLKTVSGDVSLRRGR
jgi:hypothetical protein